MWTLLFALLGIGVLSAVIGWFAHYFYREWQIAAHDRCVMCRGAGYYNDITSEHMSSRGY